MSRRARCYGSTGFYHIMMRGIDRSVIFEDAADHRIFLSILKEARQKEPVTICAYCLMSNHVHLLLNSPPDKLSVFIKRINIRYAAYFNKKYKRVGHLFQDRFRSEPIEDESYLVQVFRYILRNPEEAGLCAASQYPWSSYAAYGGKDGLTDTSALHALLGDFSAYADYISCDTSAPSIPDYDTPLLRDDSRAILRAEELLHVESLSLLKDYPRNRRNQALRFLVAHGFSARQVARITGFSRGLVERACQ